MYDTGKATLVCGLGLPLCNKVLMTWRRSYPDGLVLRRSEMLSLCGRGTLERVIQAPCELTS